MLNLIQLKNLFRKPLINKGSKIAPVGSPRFQDLVKKKNNVVSQRYYIKLSRFREEKKSQDKDKHESTKSLNKVLKNAMNSNKTKSILYMATKGNTIK